MKRCDQNCRNQAKNVWKPNSLKEINIKLSDRSLDSAVNRDEIAEAWAERYNTWQIDK